jgi:hypothetical protein
MKTLIGIEIDQLAYLKFVEEFNKLEFIPDFQLKIDTAKNNFKTNFLAECNCNNCIQAVDLIINTKWNESE